MNLEDQSIPKTLDEAVLTLELFFLKSEDDGVAHWRALPVEQAVSQSHHAIGQTIRNLWLWQEDKPLRAWFIENHGIWHADDMSSIILSYLHHRLNEQNYDLSAAVQYYKDFWAIQGVTGIPDDVLPRPKTISRYDLLRKNDIIKDGEID